MAAELSFHPSIICDLPMPVLAALVCASLAVLVRTCTAVIRDSLTFVIMLVAVFTSDPDRRRTALEVLRIVAPGRFGAMISWLSRRHQPPGIPDAPRPNS